MAGLLERGPVHQPPGQCDRPIGVVAGQGHLGGVLQAGDQSGLRLQALDRQPDVELGGPVTVDALQQPALDGCQVVAAQGGVEDVDHDPGGQVRHHRIAGQGVGGAEGPAQLGERPPQ